MLYVIVFFFGVLVGAVGLLAWEVWHLYQDEQFAALDPMEQPGPFVARTKEDV